MSHPPNESACARDGCRNPVARSDLCWAHLKRLERSGRDTGADLRPWGMSGTELLVEAALGLLEVKPTDSRGWQLAKKRMRTAAHRFVERQRRKAQSPRGGRK